MNENWAVSLSFAHIWFPKPRQTKVWLSYPPRRPSFSTDIPRPLPYIRTNGSQWVCLWNRCLLFSFKLRSAEHEGKRTFGTQTHISSFAWKKTKTKHTLFFDDANASDSDRTRRKTQRIRIKFAGIRFAGRERKRRLPKLMILFFTNTKDRDRTRWTCRGFFVPKDEIVLFFRVGWLLPWRFEGTGKNNLSLFFLNFFLRLFCFFGLFFLRWCQRKYFYVVAV